MTTNDGILSPHHDTFDLAQDYEPAERSIQQASSIQRRRSPTTPPPLRQAQSPTPPSIARIASPPVAILQTDFELETRAGENDAQFSVPALWQADDPGSSGANRHPLMWSERSAAAFLGFAAGMLIIVPAVFYLSLENTPQTASVSSETAAVTATAGPDRRDEAVKFQAASLTNGRWINASAAVPSSRSDDAVRQSSTLAQFQATEREATETARRLITDGRLSDARAMLRQAASPDTAKLWFLLAETYDPNIGGKATSPEGIVAHANRKFARFYYNQALTHGIAEARPRLAALAKMQ